MPNSARLVMLMVACVSLDAGGCVNDAPPEGTPETLASPDADAALTPDIAPDQGGPDAPPTADLPAGPPVRVLFIGNSYTYVNDVPALVKALGDATPGVAVTVEMIAVPGAMLYQHANDATTMARIRAGEHDVVVIQGQSLEALPGREAFAAFEAGAQNLGQAVADAGAAGLWFATWARRAGDSVYNGYERDPDWMTWAIEQSYTQAAEPFTDRVALVGSAFLLAQREMPEVSLYADDGSHANAAGAFLASCVLFHAVSGRSPIVPSPAPLGLPQAEAEALCALAARVVPSIEPCYERMRCDGACTATLTDPAHCGDCETVCGPEDPCRGGTCGCDAPLTACDRTCVDLQTTTQHCGDCDTACGIGQHCEKAECVCELLADVPGGWESADPLLATLRPDCGPDAGYLYRASLPCREAAHELCRASGACFDSGMPPGTGHSVPFDSATCVRGDVVSVETAALQTLEPECVDLTDGGGHACVSAIHRFCAERGATSGFGPVGSADDGDAVLVTCVPTAVVVPTTMAALYGFASRCTADPITCTIAGRAFCIDQGFAGGFGPVAWREGEAVDVVCLPR